MDIRHDPEGVCSFCGRKQAELEECEWHFPTLGFIRKMHICPDCKKYLAKVITEGER